MTSRNAWCLILCLVLLPGFVWAAAKKDPTFGGPTPDDRKLVSAVDLAKNTIDITHQSHGIKTTYVFAPNVIILINGKPATTKEVKVGLQLFSLKLGPGMDDPPTVEELELKTAQPKPK